MSLQAAIIRCSVHAAKLSKNQQSFSLTVAASFLLWVVGALANELPVPKIVLLVSLLTTALAFGIALGVVMTLRVKDAEHRRVREQFKLLMAFFESSPSSTGAIELYEDKHIMKSQLLFASRSIRRLYGWGNEAFRSRSLSDLNFSESHQAQWLSFFRRARMVNSHIEFELRSTSTSGKEEFKLIQVFPMGIKTERGNMIFGYRMSDITEQAEKYYMIKENEERLKYAFEGTDDGVWDYDIKSDKLFVSEGWFKLLGKTCVVQPVNGSYWLDMIHEEDRERVHQALQDYLNNRAPIYEVEHRLRCHDGSYKWILTRGKMIDRDQNGQILRMVGAHTDLTRRKNAEDLVRASEERWRELMRLAPVGIFQADINGNTTYMNDYWTEFIGECSSDPQHLNLNFWDHVHDDDRKKMLQKWNDSVKHSKPFEVSSFRFVKRDGNETSEVWASAKAVALASNSIVKGFLCAVMNINDKMLAQIELEKKNKELDLARRKAEIAAEAKSQFLANISHEIRTPLNGIIGLSVLLKDSTLNEDQTDLVESIHGCSSHLLDIVNDVLDFAKIEAGKIELEKTPTQLSQCIEATLSLVRSKADSKGIVLDFTVDNRVPPSILCDAPRIRQILLNLVSNALKFTEKGSVSITATVRNRLPDNMLELLVEVKDTGIGIPASKMDRLFLSFSQVDASTCRKYGGTGLGLAICKRLVKLMDGEIWCESVEGQGSSFYFTFLAEPCQDVKPRRVIKRLQTDLGQRMPLNILLAEDNPVNQKLMLKLLSKFGYNHVTVAENGREAVIACRTQPFDLILMDIQMPILGGLGATRMIRELLGHKPIIVALTASALEGTREQCLESGMDDYLCKPIKCELFADVIERLYNKRVSG